jgi:MFS family permease
VSVSDPISAATGGAPARNRHYVLAIMTLVFVVNYLDRQILGILVPQIKLEFHLEDWQIGVLTGPAFAVIYATLGIPLAVLADRVNRRNLVAASLAVFSFMTVLCGYTVQFWQLLLARFGTGIGEAGTSPAINSIIADLYPLRQRAAALSFYTAGLNVGLLFGFVGGGWIAQHYGWRDAFLAAGIPGLVLVFFVLFTIREPERGAADLIPDTRAASGFLSVAQFLWTQKSFRWIALGAGLFSFGGYANIAFLPLFLTISHHMKPAEIGLVLSLLVGVVGAVGTFMAGVVADKFGKDDIRWNMYVPIIATFVSVPFAPLFFLPSSTAIALSAAVMPALMGAAYVGPSYAMAQGMVPLRMRAQTVAILLFILNMIGLGLGPLTVGTISTLLKPALGADSLRWALMSGVITALVGAYCYWQAAKTLKSDIARAAAA